MTRSTTSGESRSRRRWLGLARGSSWCAPSRCGCSRRRRWRGSSRRATCRPRSPARRSSGPPGTATSTMPRSPASSPAACGPEATAAGARSRSSGRAGSSGALAEAALAETYDGGDDEDDARPRGARPASRRQRRRPQARDRLSRPPRLLGAGGLEGRSAGGRGIAARTRCRFREMSLPAHYAVTEGVIAGAYPGTRRGRQSARAQRRHGLRRPHPPVRPARGLRPLARRHAEDRPPDSRTWARPPPGT